MNGETRKARPVKAMPFEVIQHSDEPGSRYDFAWPETRWQIVDAGTGEILDDAQGYGYKTARNAHAAWGYKSMPRAKRKARETLRCRVAAWCKRNERFVEDLRDIMFEYAKNGGEFTAADFQRFADDGHVDLEGLRPVQIMRDW